MAIERRRSKRTGQAAVLSMLIVISLALGFSVPANAKQVSGTLTIDPGEYYGWQVDVAIPSQIEVEIEAHNGVLVDLFVVDKENYSRYAEGLPFEYYAEYSVLKTANATLNFTVLSGTVYILVDNSDKPSGAEGANPTGPAEVTYWVGNTFDLHAIPEQSNLWLMYLFVAVAGFALIMVIVLARVAIRGQRNGGGPKRPKNS